MLPMMEHRMPMRVLHFSPSRPSNGMVITTSSVETRTDTMRGRRERRRRKVDNSIRLAAKSRPPREVGRGRHQAHTARHHPLAHVEIPGHCIACRGRLQAVCLDAAVRGRAGGSYLRQAGRLFDPCQCRRHQHQVEAYVRQPSENLPSAASSSAHHSRVVCLCLGTRVEVGDTRLLSICTSLHPFIKTARPRQRRGRAAQ